MIAKKISLREGHWYKISHKSTKEDRLAGEDKNFSGVGQYIGERIDLGEECGESRFMYTFNFPFSPLNENAESTCGNFDNFSLRDVVEEVSAVPSHANLYKFWSAHQELYTQWRKK